MTDGRAAPHPDNTLNELTRRGVALLHEVGAHDGLSVRARARRPQGARRQQAAAADGAPDRVLHPDRRARPRPVRRRRRDAARGGHRPRSASGHSASSWSRAGSPSTSGSCSTSPPSATARGRVSPTSARRTRAGRAASIRPASSCASATRWPSCPTLPEASVDFVATDPPYNVQLPLTMAGGKLAETHANRRTDYAMVTEFAGRPRQRRPTTRRSSIGWAWPSGRWPGSCGRAATRRSSCAMPTRTAATCSPPPTSPRARVGGRPRAQGRPRLVPGGDPAPAVRLPARVRAEHRAPAHHRAAQGAGAARQSLRRREAR